MHEAMYWERVNGSRWGQYLTAIESRFIEDASTLAGPPRRAFEVGADTGRWSKMLADRGWKMTCTDVNEETLALCKQRVPDASVIVVDETDETLPSETAETQLLVCMEVPYVIERVWFMREAARVVAPGGYLIGVMHNRRSLRGIAHRVRAKNSAGYRFYQQSYPQWRRRLRAHGFEMVTEEGFCWFPMRRDGNSRVIPYIAGLEKWSGLRRLASVSPWVVFVARRTESHPEVPERG